MYADFPKVERFELKNGLQVVHTKLPHIATSSVQVILGAGQMQSGENEIGVAHLLEHVCLDGTKNYKDSEDLRDLIDFVGGGWNAWTNWLSVKYHANTLSRDIEKAFEFVAEVVIHPLIREEDVVKEKKIVTDESNGRQSNLKFRVWQELQKTHHLNPQLQSNVIGLPKDIESIDTKILMDFHKNNYVAKNSVLSIASPVEVQEIKKLAEKYFSNWIPGNKKRLLSHKLNPTEERFRFIHDDNAEQVIISGIAPGPSDDSGTDIGQLIANNIIGGRGYSYLNRVIREENHLSYSVKTRFSRYPNFGTREFTAGIQSNDLEKFYNLFWKTIRSLSKDGVQERELERAKNDVLTDVLFGIEKASQCAGTWASEFLYLPQFHSYEEVVAEIEKIDLDVVNREIREFAESKFKYVLASKEDLTLLLKKLTQ